MNDSDAGRPVRSLLSVRFDSWFPGIRSSCRWSPLRCCKRDGTAIGSRGAAQLKASFLAAAER
ncbi:protein of unknown function [Modestobacter italicus]|uniref:Uncharacterized protein n=1 Tax=Modestobacter italicus (strain DSM 44449 / CECT 9708 / BC 501) TaxID=2732864 RepID=I4F0M8_MODI5|nr:protein of unknown function [Modestobacter marinus]